MNYINKDERTKGRRQFTLLLSLAVILTTVLTSAFFLSTGYKQAKYEPVTELINPVTIAPKVITQKIIVTDTVSKNMVAVLQKTLEDKEKEVLSLKERVNNLKGSARKTNTTSNERFNEVSFLKLALRSQTSEVIKLKRENENLKNRSTQK